MYETDVCETAGKACGQLWNPLQNPVKTLLRIAPIALAFLVVANPLGITSSFLNAIAIAFALSTTPDLFSKEGKVKLCQGGALASGVQSTLMLVKAAVYGLSLSTAFVFVGGLAFATALLCRPSFQREWIIKRRDAEKTQRAQSVDVRGSVFLQDAQDKRQDTTG